MASQATARALDHAERRRSPRLPVNVTLIVCGQSVDSQQFQEQTSTLCINAHGALVSLAAHVSLGQRLVLMNPQTWNERSGRVTRFGSADGGRTLVGIEFSEPSPEFWPLGVPPKKASPSPAVRLATKTSHYHIRWSGTAALDWDRFDTRVEAEASAEQLVRPRETYTIEEFDGTCPRCRTVRALKDS
jgi:hypothetical protein